MKKVGRNDRCRCGSGRKFKKCCLQGAVDAQSSRSTPQKHFFELKGKSAEAVVHELAQKTFLVDWCFPNPKLPDGKELCDLLVVFDDKVIIWQVKDLKLREDGRFDQAAVEKNLRQLSGARRQLFDLKTPVELENVRRRKELFDPGKIKEVFLISVLLGEEQEFGAFAEELRKKTVHVFGRTFTRIILDEMDTVTDFCAYLREKEALLKGLSKILVAGDERELLAYYLLNGKRFKGLDSVQMAVLEDGGWDLLQNKPEFKSKKEEDRISYAWDSMINAAHDCEPELRAEYEAIARELARPSRFERRILAKRFLEAAIAADKEPARYCYRRLIPMEGTTYCLIFDDDRPRRKEMIGTFCIIARGMARQNKKVVAIATEKTFSPQVFYDFALLELEDWTNEHQKQFEKLQSETGIFTAHKQTAVRETEYPSAAPKDA